MTAPVVVYALCEPWQFTKCMLFRWSFEGAIAVRLKEIEVILPFHGLSTLLSAAGMKIDLPWWSTLWRCWLVYKLYMSWVLACVWRLWERVTLILLYSREVLTLDLIFRPDLWFSTHYSTASQACMSMCVKSVGVSAWSSRWIQNFNVRLDPKGPPVQAKILVHVFDWNRGKSP